MTDPSRTLADRLLDDFARNGHRSGAKTLSVISLFAGLGLGMVLSSALHATSDSDGEPAVNMALHSMQLGQRHRLLPQPAKIWPSAQPSRFRPYMQPVSAEKSSQPSKVEDAAVAETAAAEVTAAPAIDNAPTDAFMAEGPAYGSEKPEKDAVVNALISETDAQIRAQLATALPALEATNPTVNSASSSALEGMWIVKYTGAVAPGPVDSPTREIALLMYAAGFGPGAAALSLAKRLPDNLVEVKSLSLDITPGESRASLAVNFMGGNVDLKGELICELRADGPSKLIETTTGVRINDQEVVSIPEPLRYTRDLVITYLDKDFLIARDATGSPDILVRAN
eukprot:gnl/TRDRNA2_/TRDRNA2_192633_c0_seq1.p1 gnl/TRDRNA2_/TRDRNA2_192633_c0~~gnl/TRDRNA2_/TRDRNA2_192633_c0_seq1.p1  ORF type:complete len:340 (+),score=50.51 gnl/TRDRNA2_/TRDRNA2_192633_c0_seq1:53-1072(+)